MSSSGAATVFSQSIADVYDEYLVPLIFEPYAADLARRVVERRPRKILEIAAGTGVVTRRLARELDASAEIVATDLSQPMLDRAAGHGVARQVEWRRADAMQLPFADASFDAVVCQFGVMFFPDKTRAHSEVRRVMRSGGAFLFNVWDRLDLNEIPAAVSRTLSTLFPEKPPTFLERIPHGYHDPEVIRRDLREGGFEQEAFIETLAFDSHAASARVAAIAFCSGTPWRSEIESQGPGALARSIDEVALELGRRFGTGAVSGKIQAHVVEASV